MDKASVQSPSAAPYLHRNWKLLRMNWINGQTIKWMRKWMNEINGNMKLMKECQSYE